MRKTILSLLFLKNIAAPVISPGADAWQQGDVLQLSLQPLATLGKWPYQGIFALVSLVGLALIILGMAQTSFVPLWQPPSWGRIVPQALMLPALILLLQD